MIEFPEQVLATAKEPPHAATGQLLRQIARHRPPQPELAHLDRNDALALDGWQQCAPGDLDLRQFGHGISGNRDRSV